MCRLSKRKCFLLLAVVCRMAVASDLDYLFMSQRSFTTAHLKGLGDAGVALPGDIAAGFHNPALLYSSIKNGTGAVALGYGRDSLFSRHIMPFAIGYGNGKGALGGLYRYQAGEDGISQHEIALNLSSQLFEAVDVQGSVDFGINFRYEWIGLKQHDTRSLSIERYFIDSTGNPVYQSTIGDTSVSYQGKNSARRFIVDIGFFQSAFMENLDFGLVMRNVAGYEWKRERPILTWNDSKIEDSIYGSDTITRVERTYAYADEERLVKRWLAGRYRTLLLGIVYHVKPTDAFNISFPVDLELLGLFNRRVKNTFVFRGGIAAQIKSLLTLRFGYARQPGTVLEGITTFKNANFFTGGAGVTISSVTFDFYLSQNAFGMTAGYRF